MNLANKTKSYERHIPQGFREKPKFSTVSLQVLKLNDHKLSHHDYIK